MQKEIVGAKVGIITILYAIPIAIVSFFFAVAGLAIMGFGVGVFALFTLRFVYSKLGIEVKDFEKKVWLGNGALMFFSWLLIWILILNPPFSDLSQPSIRYVEFWVDDGTGNFGKKVLDVGSDGYIASPMGIGVGGTNIKIKANVTDNVEVDRVRIVVKFREGPVDESYMKRNNSYDYNYEYDFTLTQTDGFYTFEITAFDTSNRVNNEKVTVQTLPT